jgi:hypothetical protein
MRRRGNGNDAMRTPDSVPSARSERFVTRMEGCRNEDHNERHHSDEFVWPWTCLQQQKEARCGFAEEGADFDGRGMRRRDQGQLKCRSDWLWSLRGKNMRLEKRREALKIEWKTPPRLAHEFQK